MNTYLAHSAGAETPAQTYIDHVTAVTENAVRFADAVENYCSFSQDNLRKAVRNAAEYHDLGKLDEQNQKILHQGDPSQRLPVNHVDAGAAYCLQEEPVSGILVYSHHSGLPDFPTESLRGENVFRDSSASSRAYVDQNMDGLLQIHRSLCPVSPNRGPVCCSGDMGVFLRMGLSCLADADHSDTARARGNEPAEAIPPELLPGQRLASLERYVAELGKGHEKSQRDELRGLMFESCRDADIPLGIAACDSPVGSGKTTAVMAHLLRQAEKMGGRRVFVVLPFTNIITQSVKVYREALTLPGEDPETVVAELHHRADYEDEQTRYLSARWRAPIIVTTAVAFFETIASNRPSVLRRLHELPGSVIFVDEAHAALPVPLLPVTWHWMRKLADEWSCHWVLASGSLVRFWELDEISPDKFPVPELVAKPLREELSCFENRRISYPYIPNPVSRTELLNLIAARPGPRLVIVNTVKNAAVVANDLRTRFGKERVEHLSTALCPEDRESTLKRVRERLKSASQDEDWTLVATSCVEAGVDLSFRTGFREISSLLSLLQAAGRINRSGDAEDAEIYSFVFRDDPMLTNNPSVKYSAEILQRYFLRSIPICPELSTDAIQRELDEYGMKKTKLMAWEGQQAFKSVAESYRVIDADTVLAVVDHRAAEQVRCGIGNWRMLQKYSVAIRANKIQQYHLKEIAKGIYEWTLPYDPFLGYMAGVLTEKRSKDDFLCH